MSCTSAKRWRLLLAAACLVGLSPGCRVPPRPPNAPAPDHREEDPYEGWLFKKLTGKKSPESASSSATDARTGASPAGEQASSADSAGGVRQASSIEPVPGGDLRADRGTILPPAGAADPKPKSSDDNDGFDWSDLYPSTIFKNFQSAIGLGPDERLARAEYKEGESLYQQKKYAQAAKHFKTAADRWPDSPLEEDALFLLAECQFFTDQYSKALDTYGKLLKKHEYSRYMDKVVARQFAIGRYWERMDAYEPHWPITPNFVDKSRPLFDTWGNAVKAYENARLNDPTGPLADHAVMAAANANFLKGRYEDAAYNYDLLRKEYPKSEHLVAAHVLGMKSKLEMYQGPMYDSKALEDANRIAEQALLQFPDRLGAQKEHIIQAKNRIVEQMAEREWAMGQYYEKRGYYGAARYYYQALIDKYPQTHFGQLAKARLEEIRDKPAKPPNHFKWIDDLLPSSHNRAAAALPEGP